MTRLKLPKRLDESRSCFVELPQTEVAKGDLTGYELEFRKQYAGIFRSRTGYHFFFELPHTAARDAFLSSLEVSYKQMGVRTQRETIYPPQNQL